MWHPRGTGTSTATASATGSGRRRLAFRTVSTLAVMAHYDPDGQLAPHALRAASALREVADTVLLVSTAELTDDARTRVPAGVRLVQRENSGYDFGSWQAGLELAGAADHDQVIICNDSCVGPLVPYPAVFDAMADRACDFWGMTRTLRRGLHVQSYFVVFRSWVVRSRAFTRFWSQLEPVSDRKQVIARYEVGLSASLHAAGFASDSYFRETERDRRDARRRHLWWAANAAALRPPGRRLAALRRMPVEPWNPMAALADRALDGARLPVVKLDTLRYDPYRLGAASLLDRCEQAYPDRFAGVRDHLARTGASYALRSGEPGSATGATPPLVRLLPGLAY